MNNPGTTVYVHWYGKLLQGTVVNDNDLMGMVAVRIPLMGGHPVALFTHAHVYASAEEAKQKPAATVPAASTAGDVPTISCRFPSSKSNPSEAWQAIQQFKHEHWDQERNHLCIDALEEFYRRWRVAIAAKYGVTVEATVTVSVDPGSPDGDHSDTYIVDTRTGQVVQYAAEAPQPQPIVSEERYQELKGKMKAKLTKKQMRSTGRIEYTDSIQTSFFD